MFNPHSEQKQLFYHSFISKKKSLSIYKRVEVIQRYLSALNVPFDIVHPPFYCESEGNYMAKNFDWEMINKRLQLEDKKAFENWVAKNPATVADLVTEVATNGYKLSITWVDSSNSFVVTASGRKDEGRNKKKSLPSWSDDVQEALYMTVYKILVLFDGGEWESDDMSQNWG